MAKRPDNVDVFIDEGGFGAIAFSESNERGERGESWNWLKSGWLQSSYERWE